MSSSDGLRVFKEINKMPDENNKPLRILGAPIKIKGYGEGEELYLFSLEKIKKANLYDDFLELFSAGIICVYYPNNNTSGLLGVSFNLSNKLTYSEAYKLSKMVELQETRRILVDDFFLCEKENGVKFYGSRKVYEEFRRAYHLETSTSKFPRKFLQKGNLSIVVFDFPSDSIQWC